MPTIQELLTTIDTTYRNSYTTKQKVEWMDTCQRQIFQVVPKEAPPWAFATLSNLPFYPLPEDCDRFGIKNVTIETQPGSDKYTTLPYMSIESNQQISPTARFYSVLQDNLFLNPMPTPEDEGKTVYIIYNHRPAMLSPDDLEAVPELETDFHELLVLGVLERIARARGEIDDKNNFASDYNLLFANYKDIYKLRQPEYYKINDVMPRRRGAWNGSKASRTGRSDGMMPWEV